VSETFTFHPPRRIGLVFHVILVLLLVFLSGWGFWQAAQATVGPLFLLYLLPALISIGLVPLLVYRAFALRSARYMMERDGIRLSWGLRVEEIPMSAVIWARASEELARPLPLPWLRWPGSVIGVRNMPDGNRLEFLAATSRRLILIALPGRVFAISPENPAQFLGVFQSFMEIGSLTPLQARSVYPSFLMARIWNARPARALLLGGLLLNLILLVGVSLMVPTFNQVTLGVGPGREPIPAVRLLLLPFISGVILLMNFFLGLFFYRSVDTQGTRGQVAANQTGTQLFPGTSLVSGRVLAYLLWGTAILTAAFFLMALFFILQTG
jgi:hypothetical protein